MSSVTVMSPATGASTAKYGYELEIRFELFYLECNLDEEIVKLPQIFNTEHVHEVEDSVLLSDHAGNMFQIIVEKQSGVAFFVKGWNEVGKFYGLELRGWARLVYVRPDRFLLKITDRLDQEVTYPTPAKICHIGESPKLLNCTELEYVPTQFFSVCQRPDIYHVLEKTLTLADIYSRHMHIPLAFCQIAFCQSGLRVVVYDEHGLQMSCLLQFRNASPHTCGLEDGWSGFCALKRLTQGRRVRVGVPCSNANLMQFTLMPN